MKVHEILSSPADIRVALQGYGIRLSRAQSNHINTFNPGVLKAEHDSRLRGVETRVLNAAKLSLSGSYGYVLAGANISKARRVNQLPGLPGDVRNVVSVERDKSIWELSYYMAIAKPHGSSPKLLKNQVAFSISGAIGRHVPGRFVNGNYFDIRQHARGPIGFLNCDLCTVLNQKLMTKLFNGIFKANNKLNDTFVIAITGQANKRWHKDAIPPNSYEKIFNPCIERVTDHKVIYSDVQLYRDQASMATYHAICRRHDNA